MGGYLWRKILCEHLTRLGLRLYTIYIDSSSFEAEQDISKLNQIYSGDKKSKISQSTVQDKMIVQASTSEEAKSCKRCIENDKKRDEKKKRGEKVGRRTCDHCHCGFIDPSDELLDDLRSCGPGKRHKLKVIENKNSNISGDNNNNDNEKKKRKMN